MKSILVVPKLIAHRGAPNAAPENTLASFRKAHQLGATWVECDVMLTKDQQPIIIHDTTLDRTTNGTGYVADHDLLAIEKLDAGSGEKIPSLMDFLSLAATLDLGINLEIKESAVNAELIAHKVYSALRSMWPAHLKKPLISSAEPACLIAYRRQDPTACLAYIVDHWPFNCFRKLQKLDASILVIDYHALTKRRITRLHEKGCRVFAYTVDDPNVMQQLFSWGVDSIFTNGK